MAPAVILLLGWMLVPLTMTLYFSFKRYLPMRGDSLQQGLEWVGFENYVRFIGSSAFWPSVQATLMIVGGVLVITVVLGILLAILLDQPFWGQGVVRILVIAPFFVMPTVSALVWKNMFMDPVNGMFAHLWRFFGAQPVSWMSDASVQSIILIVSWQWLPFATLILLTAIQSLDSEPLEAAEIARASNISKPYLFKLFRENLQSSPYRYLLNLRINNAKFMLANKEKPIKEIVADCGFASLEVFYRQFRSLVKTSPAEYRKNFMPYNFK